MSHLTPSQLEKIRKPHWTELSLVLYQPQPLVQCRSYITGTFADDIYEIPVNNVTLGALADIRPDMTLMVGTAPLDDDLGRLRIRYSTTGSIVVSENDEIHVNETLRWTNGLYLTALNYYELWPVFPRIIQNPNNPEDVIFYKDYDVEYTNQNMKLGGWINMGSHRAALKDDSGFASLYYTATGSRAFFDWVTNVDYVWYMAGGIPNYHTGTTPGIVLYPTTGDYVTQCNATYFSGTSVIASEDSYRFVSIRDKIGRGTNTPIKKWELKNMSGSRGEGGYSLDILVHETLDVKANDVIMLISDDYYGDEHISLGENSSDKGVFFVGHVLKNTIKHNYKYSTTEFTVVSITLLAKEAVGFSVSVESVINPTSWTELYDMNCSKAMYHYLKWHTTLPKIADVAFRGYGHDYKIQFFDSDRTSIFDAMDNFMRGTLIGDVCADRQGKVWLEVQPQAYDYPTGTLTPIMDIEARDWMNEIGIEEAITNPSSYLEYGGISYKGPYSRQSIPMISAAPGLTPGFRGNIEKVQGLALGGRDQLNTLVGNIYANKNADFPTISMDMAHSYRNIDIAPYQVVNVDIPAEDTLRGIEIKGLYYPETMTWVYDPSKNVLLPTVDWQAVVNGTPGEKVPFVIPNDDPNPPFPPIHKPPIITDIPNPTGTLPPLIGAPPYVVIGDAKYGVIWTNNFDQVEPHWHQQNNGLDFLSGTTGNVGDIQYGNIVTCSDGAVYLLCRGAAGNGYSRVYVNQFVPHSATGTFITGSAEGMLELSQPWSLVGFANDLVGIEKAGDVSAIRAIVAESVDRFTVFGNRPFYEPALSVNGHLVGRRGGTDYDNESINNIYVAGVHSGPNTGIGFAPLSYLTPDGEVARPWYLRGQGSSTEDIDFSSPSP